MNPLKFYLLVSDADLSRIIANMIESRNLGEIAGMKSVSEHAAADILAKSADVVIQELHFDGTDIMAPVREVKSLSPETDFLMLSPESDKVLVSAAYQAGAEFCLIRPCSAVELESVMRKVAEHHKMRSILTGIRAVMAPENFCSAAVLPAENPDGLDKIRKVLGSAGMLGESGTQDILNICRMLKDCRLSYCSKTTLQTYANSLGEDTKTVRQRIRRSIKHGLTNTAALGIEDYYNDMFDQYSHALFTFDAIRMEMDLLRGKSPYGGRPSIDKFFEGLQFVCRI